MRGTRVKRALFLFIDHRGEAVFLFGNALKRAVRDFNPDSGGFRTLAQLPRALAFFACARKKQAQAAALRMKEALCRREDAGRIGIVKRLVIAFQLAHDALYTPPSNHIHTSYDYSRIQRILQARRAICFKQFSDARKPHPPEAVLFAPDAVFNPPLSAAFLTVPLRIDH